MHSKPMHKLQGEPSKSIFFEHIEQTLPHKLKGNTYVLPKSKAFLNGDYVGYAVHILLQHFQQQINLYFCLLYVFGLFLCDFKCNVLLKSMIESNIHMREITFIQQLFYFIPVSHMVSFTQHHKSFAIMQAIPQTPTKYLFSLRVIVHSFAFFELAQLVFCEVDSVFNYEICAV